MKNPWPTKAVMTQIYEKKFWGSNTAAFYSGEGSHNSAIVKPYVNAVLKFLKTHNNALTVCDLGCGDFNIGKQLVKHTKTYYAIDIVAPLIERNKTVFKDTHLEFLCLDIAEDALPKADCAILRQVLQHLSNEEIQKITPKLKAYKYIILTEHLPLGSFEPNKNKITSLGNRLKQNSGVDVLAAPFYLKIKTQEVILETVLENTKGRIVTQLCTMF